MSSLSEVSQGLFIGLITWLYDADLLEDPRFKATVFAPTNDAWERLPQQLGLPDEAALMGDARLGSLVLYHILPFKAKVHTLHQSCVIPLLFEKQTLYCSALTK
jgi:hypothetical protein